MLLNLPNAISLGRLCAVPVVVWLLLTDRTDICLWVFIGAGLSDMLDGYIARRFGRTSVLGSYLDPIADKALMAGVYIGLGRAGHVPLWLVIVIVSRDVLILGGVLLLHLVREIEAIEPALVSKANTVAQVVLATLTLARVGYDLPLDLWTTRLIYVVAATTALSGWGYAQEWFRRVHVEPT